MSEALAGQRYGVFYLGRMQLALPVESLKEVTPMGELSALPSEAACIIGAISLRGLMVPVLDLRRIIHHEGGLPPNADVIIMEHEGRLLGLAADGAVGVYALAESDVHPIGPREPLASVLMAGFERPDDTSLVSVLSPVAIANIPHVPLVRAPQDAQVSSGIGGSVEKRALGQLADPATSC